MNELETVRHQRDELVAELVKLRHERDELTNQLEAVDALLKVWMDSEGTLREELNRLASTDTSSHWWRNQMIAALKAQP